MHFQSVQRREKKSHAAANRDFSTANFSRPVNAFVDNRSQAIQQRKMINAVGNQAMQRRISLTASSPSGETVQMNSDLLLSLAYHLGVDGTATAVALAIGISPSALWWGLNALGALALTWGAQEIIDWFWARGFGGPQVTTSATDIEEEQQMVTRTTMDTEETHTVVTPAPAPIPRYRAPRPRANRQGLNNRIGGNNGGGDDRRTVPRPNQIEFTRAAFKHGHNDREIIDQIRRAWANRRGPYPGRNEIFIPWGDGNPQGIILIILPNNKYLVKHAQSAANIQDSQEEQARRRNQRAARGDSASTNNDWNKNKFN